jgi:cyclomaltodextrinase / maltogenic alpha-amylase / neopullulanase
MAESESTSIQRRARRPNGGGRRVRWADLVMLLTLVGSGCEHAASERALAGPGPAVPVAQSREEDAGRVRNSGSSVTMAPATSGSPAVPDWAADAVFYQIFPERFANGDPNNDPTRDTLEFPVGVPESWQISPWTGDWYARADWEREMGPNFYEHGVFQRRYGGDLQGVLERLDYLETLGINAIYFNPLFHARSLHKYDGNSFHHIDPYFGPDPEGDLALMSQETSDPKSWQWTAADKLFLELVRQAHAKGIRIVIDGVFNHTGRDFFAFADLRTRQQDSPYRDWYIVQAYDDLATPRNEFRYKGWWGVETLPEFADNDSGKNLHPGPKQYVMDSTKRWMDPNGDGDPSDGVDGWRLDVANEVPHGFWSEWHALVRGINPQCYTVAEMWGDARRLLEDGRFTATMNYHGFAVPVKGFLIDEVLPASAAAKDFDARRNVYPQPVQYALQNLLDSHDTDRLASMIVNAGKRAYEQPDRFDFDIGVSPRYVRNYDVRKPTDDERQVQRLVALLQMTYIGAPMIYYGTEAGMWGADDPCDRMPMVWPDLAYQPQQAHPLGRERPADAVSFDKSLFGFYQTAIALRRHSPALRRGIIEFVAADDTAQFLAFRRADEKESLLVGLNRGDKPYRWEIPVADGAAIEQIFTASGNVEQFSIDRQTGQAIVTVPGRDGVVLRIAPSE